MSATKVLPNGQTIRIGSPVVASYWKDRDIEASVIGWRPGYVTVDYGPGGLDIPEDFIDEVQGAPSSTRGSNFRFTIHRNTEAG